jgi:fused signal recognition particle receptor
MTEAADEPRGGWLARLAAGLGRSSQRITQGIAQALGAGRRLDAAALADLEEVLIAADIGVETAAGLTANLAKARFDDAATAEAVREALAGDIAGRLAPYAAPLAPDPAKKPYVVLVVGVNGTGKTTTIAKLAKLHREAGARVMLAAGDTFRAAGVSQLRLWGERVGCPVIARETGADAAGLAFDALAAARQQGMDLLLIDTAGRVQNRSDLMAGLQKIIRVLRKLDAEAPHATILVLDATVGQNAHSQVEIFREMAQVTGLIVTKLDGTARGGVLVALAERFKLPVHAVGVGEGADDLRPFDARAYARGLMGLPVQESL